MTRRELTKDYVTKTRKKGKNKNNCEFNIDFVRYAQRFNPFTDWLSGVKTCPFKQGFNVIGT